jgi:hypothetical protein
MDKERVEPAAQSAAAVEWRLADRDRFVIRYEFASRQWSGQVEPYDDATGTLGELRDLAPAQIETIRSLRSRAERSAKGVGLPF